jgi:bacterioferritin-associated ferredoxin
MIVCLCYGKSEREVDAAIRAGADSVEAVGDRCGGAGTGCGACVEEIAQRLGCSRGGGGCGGSVSSIRSRKAD